jgi:C1A family cysteine protease
MPRRVKKFGWIPDLPDARDHVYAAPIPVLGALPPRVDLRAKCPPVLNQGELGSCTANAIANAHRFDQMKQGVAATFGPSRLFIYYNERSMEHTVNEDAGAMIRDGVKSISKLGVCDEKSWPYTVAKFTTKPPAACYKEALTHQALSYQRVPTNLQPMKACLASGYPFVFGMTVYSNFESSTVAKTGVVNLPTAGEETVGGHAVLCVGYDDKTQRFLVMNSWGTDWGRKGFFTIPYAYLTNDDLADDFWTIRVIEI